MKIKKSRTECVLEADHGVGDGGEEQALQQDVGNFNHALGSAER